LHGNHSHPQVPRPSGSPCSRATSGTNHSWPSISPASSTRPTRLNRNPEGSSLWVCQIAVLRICPCLSCAHHRLDQYLAVYG
jgi:hypothetical protein